MSRYRKIVLRESELATPGDVHCLLARKLGFPNYYGNNLDALEDCLGDIDSPTRIVIKRSAKNPQAWFDGFEEVIRDSAIRSCFLACTIR